MKDPTMKLNSATLPASFDDAPEIPHLPEVDTNNPEDLEANSLDVWDAWKAGGFR